MQQVRTIFQVSVFLLTAQSAVMLAMADKLAFLFLPQALTCPLALLAYFFTERWNTLRLQTFGANCFGLLAVAVAGTELIFGLSNLDPILLEENPGLKDEIWLISGTHLLIYLTWVVLFQEKKEKQYWWMFALSILLVAVGAVLTPPSESGSYVLWLVPYLFFSIWSLTLFALYESWSQHQIEGRSFAFATAGSPAIQLTSGELDLSREQRAQSAAPTRDDDILQPSRVAHGTVLGSSRHSWIDGRFVAATLLTGSASLVIAAMFFLLVPRKWIGQKEFTRNVPSSPNIIGFNEEVLLGSFGEILESSERVLFVRMYNEKQGTEIDVGRYAFKYGHDEPLFRGAVLGTYQDGKWVVGQMGLASGRRYRPENLPPNSVRQEYRLKPIGTNFLFAMHPVNNCRLDEVEGLNEAARRVHRHRFSAMLSWVRPHGWQKTLQYTVYSPPPPSIRSEPQISFQEPQSQSYATPLWEQCETFPNDAGRLDELQALARQISDYDAVVQQSPTHLEMAGRLETHLRDSGEYGYSLDSSVHDPQRDPVEDFLFNRKLGHCEYFASALALMLRAVEIPSRLVNGFKGGEKNRFTGDFEVEQRHAHAWVEAYIDGRWLMFDPTPADARSESVASMALGSWAELEAAFNVTWFIYGINIGISTQERSFYGPARRALEQGWEMFRGQRSGTAEATLREFFSTPKRWLSWQGCVFTFVLLIVLAAVLWTLRRALASLKRTRSTVGRGMARPRIIIDFYERFRKLCAKHGLVREASQTEREFAHSVNDALAVTLNDTGLKPLTADLVESFYQVRYGAEEIDPLIERDIDRRLTLLEDRL